MKLLIVDDDMVFRMIASKMWMLVDSSVEIEECENGEQGLASLKKQKDLSQKIVVLLDINMPVLDGWSFLEQIEENNFYNLSQLNIYIVSSSADERDVLKAKRFGFLKGFIQKPLSEEDITAIIES